MKFDINLDGTVTIDEIKHNFENKYKELHRKPSLEIYLNREMDAYYNQDKNKDGELNNEEMVAINAMGKNQIEKHILKIFNPYFNIDPNQD